MARQFLTGLNLNKNELLNAKIQNLSTAPSNPVTGQIYFDTDTHQLTVWDGTSWLSLAAGGNVQEAITAAIDAIDTDAIEEGASNLYYTTSRAKEDAADLLTSATKTNITITGDGTGLTITAENGVADSTTDDLDEGSTNLYFTDQRAIDAVGGSATSANTPNTVVKRDGNGAFAAGTISTTGVNVQDAGQIFEDSSLIIQSNSGYPILIQGNQDVDIQSLNGDIVLNADGTVYINSSGSAANRVATYGHVDAIVGDVTIDGSTGNTVKDRIDSLSGDLNDHTTNSSAHGVLGDVVGTSDAQSLTNKTLGSGTVLSATVDANGNTITDLGAPSADTDAATKGYVDDEIATHAADTSSHGVTTIVGASEAQTLTNKVLGASTSLGADLDAEGYRILAVGTPVMPTDAANKEYVDSVSQGISVKEGVDSATTEPLATTTGGVVTYDNGTIGVGATLTLATPLTTLDGHTLTNGDRVLIKDEAEPAYNGIYVRTSSTVFTRDTTFDSDEEIEGGTFVFVVEGTVNGSTGWVMSSTVNDVGVDDMIWLQFSGAGTYTAGNGLTLTGTTFDVVGTSNRISVTANAVDIASTYVGQTSITTLGTITTGVWNGTDIAVADGGTGSSTAAGARANLGATTKYTEANPELTVSSGEVTWTVTHNLGIRTVVVQVYDTVNFDSVEVDVERTNTNAVTLQWPASATVDAGKYQVVIIG